MKGAKQGVDSRMTLLSQSGRGSEWHYSQNEKKMAYCIGNKSKLWHALFCFTPAVWLHLNKYKFALSHTHKHAGEIIYHTRKQCLYLAQDPTQNFLRRPEIFSFMPTGLWSVSPYHQGPVLETTSPLSMGRLFKQHQGCAIPELAAQETRPPLPAFILLQVPPWVLPCCDSQPSAGKG